MMNNQMTIIKELSMRLMVIKIYLKQRYRDKTKKTFSILQINLNDRILIVKEVLIQRLEDKLESKQFESIISLKENNRSEIKKQRV